MLGSGVPRILIVEDDQTVLGFLSRVLERAGYQPVAVNSGEEALAAVRGPEGVDAILIDGILPDMHGARLAGQVLDDPIGALVPICFVSGAVRDNRTLDAGVGALGKPVRLRDVEVAVAEMLAWRQSGGSDLAARRASLRRLEQGFLVGP
jgi:two-component system, cell cycle response regulator CpdR